MNNPMCIECPFVWCDSSNVLAGYYCKISGKTIKLFDKRCNDDCPLKQEGETDE